MGRPRIVVTRRLTPEVEAALAVRFDTALNPDDAPMSPARLARALAEADGVLATVVDRFDAGVFDAAGAVRARIIANFGAGHGNIDLPAAARHGVAVTNTPDVLTDDTADLAILLMLMAARRAGEGERLVRRGAWTGWAPTQLLGRSLRGRRLGVVGFGRIGAATARRAALGLGMQVSYWNRSVPPSAHLAGLEAERVPDLDELLRRADVVSLHVPATPDTRHLLDRRRLALLSRDAILVNTARGDIVDEEALVEALEAGRLLAAGLDVYAEEPAVPARLRALEQVVLLPHLGSATHRAREAMGRRALANLVAFFDGSHPPDRVDTAAGSGA